jgi:hypothetical protein
MNTYVRNADEKTLMDAGPGNDGFNAGRLFFLYFHELHTALFHFKVGQEPAGNGL